MNKAKNVLILKCILCTLTCLKSRSKKMCVIKNKQHIISWSEN